MDTFRNQRSPGSDRFLGLSSSSSSLQPNSPSPAASAAGIELDEDDVFWMGADSCDSSHSSKPPLPMAIPIPTPRPDPNPNPNPNPSPRSSNSFRRISDRNFGILAALPEDDKERKSPLLQRWPSITAAASSASTSPSSSSPRMIPALPKPKQAEYSLSEPAGKVYHQSAPVNVPVGPPRQMNGWGEPGFDDVVAEIDGDEDEMLPPHEIVARAKESPMTTFSVLEGAGRTLKGRDLRRVRNAVWRQTGFLD